MLGPKSQERPGNGKGTGQGGLDPSGTATAPEVDAEAPAYADRLRNRPSPLNSAVVGHTAGGGVGDSPVRGTLVADGSQARGEGEAVMGRLLGDRAGNDDSGVRGALVPAGSAPQSLQAKRAAALAMVDDRIRRRATSIVDSALRAPDLASLPEDQRKDGGPPPKGWTARQRRIALDATNSMKSAPAYLAMAQRVVESYKKAEADRPQAPTINAEVVQVHVSVANYPRRRLSED